MNNVTQASVQFRFVDFRLLYVVILGTVHGMRIGISAALLACVSCILYFLTQRLTWEVLVYDVNNWLPFAAYLIAGAVTGYVKDKSENTKKVIDDQMKSLEDRYLFLYELYDQTLKNKSQYKDQLMSYRDSFGRIYSITKKLDTVLPDAVFREAVNVLEDVLENQSIAIYTVTPEQKYGRLAVSSRKLLDKAEGSIQLSRFSTMMNQLAADEVWFNRDLLQGYRFTVLPYLTGIDWLR